MKKINLINCTSNPEKCENIKKFPTFKIKDEYISGYNTIDELNDLIKNI